MTNSCSNFKISEFQSSFALLIISRFNLIIPKCLFMYPLFLINLSSIPYRKTLAVAFNSLCNFNMSYLLVPVFFCFVSSIFYFLAEFFFFHLLDLKFLTLSMHFSFCGSFHDYKRFLLIGKYHVVVGEKPGILNIDKYKIKRISLIMSKRLR